MSADRDITPRVVAYLRAELPKIPRTRRVGPLVAQEVLRQLARWARATDEPGHWTTGESVAQIETGTGIPAGTVRKALDNLERLGLVATIRRGGGHGLTARGSTRLLVLDPAGQPGSTARAKRAVFKPQLRALRTSTARARTSTARAQARDTASSSATSSTPAGPADCSPIPGYLRERWADRLGDAE